MKIRKYNESDSKNIKRLVYKVLFEIFKSKPSGLNDLGNIKKNYDVFYVLEDKGKIIGCAGIQEYKENIARLKRLYLDKNYRGKGYGLKLLEKQLKSAKKLGYKKIMFSSHKKFESALNLYKKFKFVQYMKRGDQLFFRKSLR